MIADPIYLLRFNLFLAVLYLFYRLLFNKDTFFKLRRFTLLAMIGIAAMGPLIDLQSWFSGQHSVSRALLNYSTLLPEINISSETFAEGGERFSPIDYFYWIYLTGVAFLFARFLLQLKTIIGFIRRSRTTLFREISIHVPDDPVTPFSFFRWIFMNPAGMPEKETEEILAHESAHASQWHSIDVLLCELLCISSWINPFVWLLKKEIRYNLEFLADDHVVTAGYDIRSYQYHLLGLVHSEIQAATVSNLFNMSNLKKRIQMMNQERSSGMNKTKYLLIIPIVAILLFIGNLIGQKRAMQQIAETTETALATDNGYVAEENAVAATAADTPAETKASPNEESIFSVADVMPEFPGGQEALMKYLAANLQYPAKAQAEGIQGRVICSFVVEKNGMLSDFEITRGVDPLLDAESIRVIQAMPAWKPGMQKGKTVRVKYTIPVTFRLQ